MARANWGGKRHGSGRKRRPASVLVHPSSTAAAREPVDPPAYLAPEELAEWISRAPAAWRGGTLTPGSAPAFARLCRMWVLERVEAEGGGAAGSNHRGLLKLIESLEARFGLVPMAGRVPAAAGAPAAPGAPASGELDPNEAFFAAGRRA